MFRLFQPRGSFGRWKRLKNGKARCPKCKTIQENAWDANGYSPFCNTCGADMRLVRLEDIKLEVRHD